MKITGTIDFVGATRPLRGVTVRVRLERVTFADAPATVLAETQVSAVDIDPAGRTTVPFTLETPLLGVAESYSIRAHADTTGDGRVTAGDFVSTRSYPVGPSEPTKPLQIEVKPV